jgi:hypothetical protein
LSLGENVLIKGRIYHADESELLNRPDGQHMKLIVLLRGLLGVGIVEEMS